jgi:hypothetical protein
MMDKPKDTNSSILERSFRVTSSSQRQLAAFLGVFIVAAWWYWDKPLMYLSGDSIQYINFAQNLRGDFQSPEYLQPAYIVRTPGYPLLLAGTQALALGDFRIAVLTLHALFGVIALFSVINALKTIIPIPLAAIGFSLLPSLCWEIFPAVMSEWMVVMSLMILWSTWIVYLTSHKDKTLYISSVVTLLLVAIKPLFIFVCLVPALLAISRGSINQRCYRITLVGLILSPLLQLMVLNQQRFGVFSVSPAGSLSFLGVTASLASAPVSSGDSEQTKAILGYINERRSSASPSEFSKLGELRADSIFQSVSSNYETVIEAPRALRVEWRDLFSAISLYNRRVITEHPDLYKQFVVSGLQSLQLSLLVSFPSFVAPLYLLYRRRLVPLAIATLLFFAVHIGATTIVSFIGIIHNRYYNTTYFPLLVISALSTVCFVRELIAPLPRER